MKRYALVLGLGIMLVAWGPIGCNTERGVQAQQDPEIVLTTADQEFMSDAAKSHSEEIDMARLAQQQSTNNDVKDYAGMLENDHQKALEDLSDLMTKNNVSDIKAGDKDTEHMESMRKLSPAQFDRMYIDMMVANHQKALENYRAESASATYGDLKEYVDKMIPTIEKHWKEAQRLQAVLASSTNT